MAIWTEAVEYIPPPAELPATPPARVRVYSGDWLPAGISIRQAGSFVRGQFVTTPQLVSGSGRITATLTLPNAPAAGNTMIFVLVFHAAGPPVTPAGFTQSALIENDVTRIAVYTRVVVAGDSATVTMATGTTAAHEMALMEWTGTATVTPVDRTATASGTGTALTSGTTAATTQASEMAIAVFARNQANTGRWLLNDGYQEVTQVAGAVGSLLIGSKSLSATGAQTATATNTGGSVTWAGAILTLKSASQRKFNALSECDAVRGHAVMRPYDLGECEFHISTADPASQHIREGTVLEVYTPATTFDNAATFGWYLVEHLTLDETSAEPEIVVRGMDLRSKIAGRTIAPTTLGTLRSAPPAIRSSENWVRAYITNACITIPSSQSYPIVDTVPGLVLEGVSGNRGTTYPEPPAKAGAGLGETITNLYRRDELGWRAVLKNPSSGAATFEFQTYCGIDRTLGQPGQAVFAVRYDTANRLVHLRDGIDAVTALTGMGGADGAVRPLFYVEDASTKQVWGLRHGYVDMSTENEPTADVARAYLSERLPKEWVELEMRETVSLRLSGIGLLDRVTAVTATGKRVDALITALRLDIGQGRTAESGATADLPRDAKARIFPNRGGAAQTISVTLGETPESAPDGGRDRDPAELRDYTHLFDLTRTGADINTMAINASWNPQQGAQADSVATTVPGVVADLNALLAKLRPSGAKIIGT